MSIDTKPSQAIPSPVSSFSQHTNAVLLDPPSPAQRLEAEKTVEGVGDGRAAVARGLDLGLGVLALRLGGVVGAADVGELVADAVDDDVGVQGVLLALGDNRVGGEEGALVRLAARTAELEVDGGSAGTEVSGATGIARIGVVASVVVVVVVVPGIVVVVVASVVVLVVVSGIVVLVVVTGVVVLVVVTGVVVLVAGVVVRIVCVSTSSAATAGIIGSVVVGSVVIGSIAVAGVVVGIVVRVAGVVVAVVLVVVAGVVVSGVVVASVGVAGVGVASSGTASSLAVDGEVGEALGLHHLGDGQAAGVKGARQRGGRVGVLGVGAGDGRVDEGHDAAEGLGGGERGVAADVGDAGGEGVEVLLGGDEALGGVEDVGAVAESGDLVGKLKLGAGVGGAEESAGDASGERGGFAGAPAWRAETAATGVCSWPKRASTEARMAERRRSLEYDMLLDCWACWVFLGIDTGCRKNRNVRS
ncbi:glycine-rich cell wall structural protein-like [Colletotrichum tofieldiae]|nr:glycine-rich cell wall structural protein-like [Colletotrichum tofieldiae]